MSSFLQGINVSFHLRQGLVLFISLLFISGAEIIDPSPWQIILENWQCQVIKWDHGMVGGCTYWGKKRQKDGEERWLRMWQIKLLSTPTNIIRNKSKEFNKAQDQNIDPCVVDPSKWTPEQCSKPGTIVNRLVCYSTCSKGGESHRGELLLLTGLKDFIHNVLDFAGIIVAQDVDNVFTREQSRWCHNH